MIKTPTASHIEEVYVNIDDRLEDMIHDIGEKKFRRTHVYGTL